MKWLGGGGAEAARKCLVCVCVCVAPKISERVTLPPSQMELCSASVVASQTKQNQHVLRVLTFIALEFAGNWTLMCGVVTSLFVSVTWFDGACAEVRCEGGGSRDVRRRSVYLVVIDCSSEPPTLCVVCSEQLSLP